MIREINKEQYLQTMGKHMKNVTDNAEVTADTRKKVQEEKINQ